MRSSRASPSTGSTEPRIVDDTSRASGKVWSNRRSASICTDCTAAPGPPVAANTCTVLGSTTWSVAIPYAAEARLSICRISVTG